MDTKQIAPPASPEARAQRMRELREWHKLSRDVFVPYGIATTSMQNWEKVRYAGLTHKGARRLVKAYEAMGISVTEEWLLYGTGPSPLPSMQRDHTPDSGIPPSEEEKITQELRLFHQLNKDAVDLIVPDNAMSPAFLPGDCVAGRRYFDSKIEKAVGHPCIVHTQNGQVLLRLLESGDRLTLYTLTGTNPETPTIANVALFSAAPVLWMRRRGSSP